MYTHLRLILSDYKQMIQNLLLFSRQMVSTMEDEVIATLSIILLCAAMKLLKKTRIYIVSLKKRKVKRNCCTRSWIKRRNVLEHIMPYYKSWEQERIQDVKLGEAYLKKISRIFFWVFRVKNHDFMQKYHIFSNFRGGSGRRCAPPGSAPGEGKIQIVIKTF